MRSSNERISMKKATIFVVLLVSLHCQKIYTAEIAVISDLRFLTKGDTLVSPSGVFELGFFRPGSSENRYVGIWYKKISVQTVVWVANRDSPLTGASSGTLKIVYPGNLVLVNNGTDDVVWSCSYRVLELVLFSRTKGRLFVHMRSWARLLLVIGPFSIVVSETDTMNIGAILILETINGKVSTIAIKNVVDDVDSDTTILPGKTLVSHFTMQTPTVSSSLLVSSSPPPPFALIIPPKPSKSHQSSSLPWRIDTISRPPWNTISHPSKVIVQPPTALQQSCDRRTPPRPHIVATIMALTAHHF
ncbi:hypothetical protein L2E82_25889 [Cichorium intybus]|uniref:Uncharacterized protein n=1 Tax=Cichorium intybus TaxID=13427 RepID=A0ACB9E4Q4_CICIN|nr:hypothetical protein L2E82_25889 [Cichorium intybus]